MSAEISQISVVPELDGVVNLFFSWWNSGDRVLIFPILEKLADVDQVRILDLAGLAQQINGHW